MSTKELVTTQNVLAPVVVGDKKFVQLWRDYEGVARMASDDGWDKDGEGNDDLVKGGNRGVVLDKDDRAPVDSDFGISVLDQFLIFLI